MKINAQLSNKKRYIKTSVVFPRFAALRFPYPLHPFHLNAFACELRTNRFRAKMERPRLQRCRLPPNAETGEKVRCRIYWDNSVVRMFRRVFFCSASRRSDI